MSEAEYPVSSAIYEDAVAQANREKARGDRLELELEAMRKATSESSNAELALAWELGVLDGQLADGRRRIIPNPYKRKS